MQHLFIKVVLVLLLSNILLACGGGDSKVPPDPAIGYKWDQMEWGQGKWS